MKRVELDEAIKLLTPKLEKAQGRITASDAAAASGLALEDVKEALDVLMNRYLCRLQITESGEILFNFGSSLTRRGKKSFKEIMASIGDALWKVFVALFKIWITVTLVVYFVLFVVILIALILASSSRDSDRKGGFSLHFIGDLFGDLFRASSHGMVMVYATDPYGYRHKTYQQVTRKDVRTTEPKKRLVQSVYDFVFGPPRPNFDPLANEKEVVAYLRENKGVLTTSELVALAGYSFQEAEEKLTEYLTRFKGTPDITDDGLLHGKFPQIMAKGDVAMDGGKIEYFWDEYEAPFVATGNTGGRNAAIVGMSLFNLIFAAIMLFETTSPTLFAEAAYQLGLENGTAFGFWTLGVIPFVFSLLFFLVPILRMPGVVKQERARLERNKLRRIKKVIFLHYGEDLTFEQVFSKANAGSQQPLKENEVKRLLEKLLISLNGESVLAEDGTVLYRFHRVSMELQGARQLRQNITDDGSQLGSVVFDSGS